MQQQRTASVLLSAALATVLLVGVWPAAAGLVPIGEPFAGWGWVQRFEASDMGEFDLLAVRTTARGTSFGGSVFEDFSAADWSTTQQFGEPTSVWAVAEGPVDSRLSFVILFSGDVGVPEGPGSAPVEFDFVAFGATELLESVHVTWNGSKWLTTAGGWMPERAELDNPVPLPGAVLLGLMGLGTVTWIKRRLS